MTLTRRFSQYFHWSQFTFRELRRSTSDWLNAANESGRQSIKEPFCSYTVHRVSICIISRASLKAKSQSAAGKRAEKFHCARMKFLAVNRHPAQTKRARGSFGHPVQISSARWEHFRLGWIFITPFFCSIPNIYL